MIMSISIFNLFDFLRSKSYLGSLSSISSLDTHNYVVGYREGVCILNVVESVFRLRIVSEFIMDSNYPYFSFVAFVLSRKYGLAISVKSKLLKYYTIVPFYFPGVVSNYRSVKKKIDIVGMPEITEFPDIVVSLVAGELSLTATNEMRSTGLACVSMFDSNNMEFTNYSYLIPATCNSYGSIKFFFDVVLHSIDMASIKSRVSFGTFILRSINKIIAKYKYDNIKNFIYGCNFVEFLFYTEYTISFSRRRYREYSIVFDVMHKKFNFITERFYISELGNISDDFTRFCIFGTTGIGDRFIFSRVFLPELLNFVRISRVETQDYYHNITNYFNVSSEFVCFMWIANLVRSEPRNARTPYLKKYLYYCLHCLKSNYLDFYETNKGSSTVEH